MITQLAIFWTIIISKIAIDLSKEQGLDADAKAIQQINFTANLDRRGPENKIFHYRRSETNNFRFFTRNFESIVNFFYFNIISV